MKAVTLLVLCLLLLKQRNVVANNIDFLISEPLKHAVHSFLIENAVL
jgi:hypothetical protein